MRGRRWSEGAIALNFTMFAPGFEKGKGLVDYVGALRTLWTVAMALPSPISRSFPGRLPGMPNRVSFQAEPNDRVRPGDRIPTVAEPQIDGFRAWPIATDRADSW